MKTFILIFVLIGLASCNPFKLTTHSTDLSRYSEKGFVMTTAQPGTHKPVAILSAVCTQGAVDSKEARQRKADPLYNDILYTNIRLCTHNTVLDELYKAAIDNGATAVYGIVFTQTKTGMAATGLAVK